MATHNENLVERRQYYFRMIGVGSDCGSLLRALHGALGVAGQDRKMLPTLAPDVAVLPLAPLQRPPQSRRPDRPEIMGEPGKNKSTAIRKRSHFINHRRQKENQSLITTHNEEINQNQQQRVGCRSAANTSVRPAASRSRASAAKLPFNQFFSSAANHPASLGLSVK